MKSQIYNHGGPICKKVMKVAKPSSAYHIGTSTPPQRQRLDMDNSFEPIGVSEVSSEPELRTDQLDLTIVEIEDLQDGKFARNFN